MKNTRAKRSPSPVKNAPPAIPLTFQGRVEKWFLPVVFVIIGVVLAWTFAQAFINKK